MADADTARLCTQIVHSHFGPLAAKVARVLLTRGRLSMPQLVRFSTLKPRTIRATVIALIQHNLLWHTELEDEGEVLEFNEEECLMRLRFGKFVVLAGQMLGEAAAQVISAVLQHGKLQPTAILQRLSVSEPKESASYMKAVNKLVSGSYLKPSTPVSHISKTDRQLRIEADLRKGHKGIPTAKDIIEWKVKAEAQVNRENDEAEKVGMKRKAIEVINSKSNKRKVTEEVVVDHEVFFRVNHAKFNIHIRNTIIEQAARERFNDAAARVLRATVQATESKQLTLEDVRSEPVSVANVSMQIPDEVDLGSGIAFASSSRVLSAHELLKEYLAILACADNPTPAGRAGSFVSVGGGSGKVQVEFEIICKRLRRHVLEAVARERYGDDAVRIIRILLTMDKMDERHLAKIAMMSHKDVRPLLASLSSDSLISLQEVPRGNDRNPSRTFYLWHVDLKKAYSVLLRNIHKTLFNILSRKQAEEEEPMVKSVLEKFSRSDVMGDESLLSRAECEVLREFESKREKLAVLEHRVEEAAFILRDLAVVSGSSDRRN